jgi:cephalosporin-C deacetylase-like acetyl esterase
VVTRRANYGDGFIIENVVYESRPQLLVTANLYLPEKVSGRIPAIVVVHSHHAPKTQTELQDTGMTWARAGVAVLVPDQLGAGERVQSNPWPRESYYSRYALGIQLHLAGESLMKWMVWDLMRSIDLLLQRPYIDPARIVMLGAVAGGGDPAAVTAALDERVAAVIPFNFGEAGPEEHYTEGPRRYSFETADPGWGSWETTRNLWRSAADQFFPWFICASVAPRRFVYSFEIDWPQGLAREPAWARYQRIFGLYGRSGHLAEVHGFGPFPGPGECTNVGTFLRKRIYPVLRRWLDVTAPAEEYHNPRPEAELMALTEELAAARRPKAANEVALDIARDRLHSAPRSPAALRARLGDIEPDSRASVPFEFLKPDGASGRLPAVIVFSQQGKRRYLAERGADVKALLEAGIAVCLPDVRGTGDTAPGNDRGPRAMGLAATELMLGTTLFSAQLKDARGVLAQVRARDDVDPSRILLFGDSLAPVNPEFILPYESMYRQLGPRPLYQAEPLGPLLALFTALYEQSVGVAARRGLSSFVSVLEDRFCYVPLDVVVPGIIEAGDIPDVIAALGPRVFVEGSVDGRNRPVKAEAGTGQAISWLIRQAKR